MLQIIPNFLNEKKCVSLQKRATLFKTRIKNNKDHRVLQLDQSKWLKPCIEFNTQKRIEAEKKGDNQDLI